MAPKLGSARTFHQLQPDVMASDSCTDSMSCPLHEIHDHRALLLQQQQSYLNLGKDMYSNFALQVSQQLLTEHTLLVLEPCNLSLPDELEGT